MQILAPAQVLGPRTDDRAIDFEQAQGRPVDRLDLSLGPERHDASGDALEHGLDVLAALVELLVLALEIDTGVLEFALARRQLPRHRIERFDQRTELVPRLGLDAVIEMAGADLARAGGEQLYRTRDALGQIQTGPGRAHQNHQRHHDEERQVDATNRPAQRPPLAAILVRLDDGPRMLRGLARQIVAGEHDADHAARGVPDRGTATHELAAAVEWLGGKRVSPAASHEGGEMIGRGAHSSGREARRFDGDERRHLGPVGARPGPVHLDQPDPPFRDLAFDRSADGDEIARLDCGRGNRARDPRSVAGNGGLAITVVVLRDLRGRREHVIRRLAEPLLGAAANQLAADDEDEDAGHDGQA